MIDNPDKVREKNRDKNRLWLKQNPHKAAEAIVRAKLWATENKDKSRAWRHKNRERRNQNERRYRQERTAHEAMERLGLSEAEYVQYEKEKAAVWSKITALSSRLKETRKRIASLRS